MKIKGPKILKFIFIATVYPTIYLAWVKQIQNSWVNNSFITDK